MERKDEVSDTATAVGTLPTPVPYTVFSQRQKRLLIALLGFATVTSPLTATIYFPLLPLLRDRFHTSSQAINLTITIYIIFQAISPAVFGPLSDSLGRRPVYLVTLSLYLVANLGLAINQDSYGALLGLRALQSLGASAAYAVSFGVVADVCVPSERGSMLGPVSMALNLGACIGPVIGGWVVYSSGSFQWVFRALVIIAAALVFLVGLLLPETARVLVADGSGRARLPWWERTWWSLLKKGALTHAQPSREGEPQPFSSPNEGLRHSQETPRPRIRARLRIGNPAACLRIIFHRDTFLVLWMHASFYTVDYSLVAAIPDIYQQIYRFNALEIGLAYLPRGVGIIVGGFCVGKAMDWNYRATAREINWNIDHVSGDDLLDFPIERARSRGSRWLLLVSTAGLVGYGWAVHYHVHPAVLLALQFLQGFWGTCFYTVYNTLLVDVFPESPSTAAAAASIARCAMAAAGVAVLQPLLAAAGRGWYFTVLGLWSGSCGAMALWLIRKKGMAWRRRRCHRKEGSLAVLRNVV
ncbi:hypothetical protein A1O3_00990 [Capronia epimyces CBS 606.96]|uniref:Major facilitator superfamily (MFS) profile domain-containing protein n=1 Tax=Capronia epimyces CBS 606.96 TaxID=1182542 RepID=W9ZD55_9EURO|nr:uncharacterized protein A1O3_00990 [Capronia epimyces CBS 606.96]EXJ92439.1 hypothetical protein A1O3_00990 [Capronia epimyces CBS 606.96]